VINPDILRERDALARQFRTAQPFRHVQIDGFLDAAACQRILDDFPRFEERHALNEMGQVGGKAVRMDVRDVSAAYRALDSYLQTREFLDFVSTVTGIPELLYDPDYIGGGTHENRDGQGLDAHVDFNYHPRTKTHRRLNLIVYLNHEWDESWGGVLELHSDPWNPPANRTRSVLPLFNRAVIFETTEASWHGFSRIHLPDARRSDSRKSFAIYLYTRERPAAETAPPHATIYVPDALPASVSAGHALAPADVAELQARFTRLRTQLRYLYDREKQFGAQIAAVEGALDEARAAFRAPLQGYATQPRVPLGMWPDLWVGPDFALFVEPQRAVKGIELDLWAPDQLDAEQVLHIDIDGQRWQHHVARGARSKALLPFARRAGAGFELRIRAEHSFVPSRHGASGDGRELAWRLLGVTLAH
jgi:hypothetical protein